MRTKCSRWNAWICLTLLGAILLGGLACGIPLTATKPAATSQPSDPLSGPPKSSPPAPLVTITATPLLAASKPGTAGAATVAPETGEVQIFLVAIGDGGNNGKEVGCGDSLVPVKRQVQAARQPIVAALRELFSSKNQFYGQSGLYNSLYQSDLHVDSAEVDENGIATIVLSGKTMLGGVCDIPRFKGQIEQTVLAGGGVQSANILLNGKTIDEALSLK